MHAASRVTPFGISQFRTRVDVAVDPAALLRQQDRCVCARPELFAFRAFDPVASAQPGLVILHGSVDVDHVAHGDTRTVMLIGSSSGSAARVASGLPVPA